MTTQALLRKLAGGKILVGVHSLCGQPKGYASNLRKNKCKWPSFEKNDLKSAFRVG